MNHAIETAKLNQVLATFFGVPEHKWLAGPEGVWVETLKQEMAELGLMLAGGTITSIFTGKHVNDLDFYIKDERDLKKAQDFFLRVFHNGKDMPYISRNAATYKRKSDKSAKVWTIQLISRFTGNPWQIMGWFDFTITQGVYDFGARWEIIDERKVFIGDFFFGDRFFQDIGKRKLVYLGSSKYPICAMHRTKKYIARGYDCPGSTIMHIALSIVQLKIENYGQLKDQLMGIDTSYLQNLLGEDRYNDALPVDYGTFLQEALDSINGFAYEDHIEEDGSL
jgi:hypothetical protein